MKIQNQRIKAWEYEFESYSPLLPVNSPMGRFPLERHKLWVILRMTNNTWLGNCKSLLVFLKNCFNIVKNVSFKVNINKIKFLSHGTLCIYTKIHMLNMYFCKQAHLLLLIVSKILLRNINNLLCKFAFVNL